MHIVPDILIFMLGIYSFPNEVKVRHATLVLEMERAWACAHWHSCLELCTSSMRYE